MCKVCLNNLYVVLSYSRCLRIGLKGSGDGLRGLEGGLGTSGLFKLGASRRGRFAGSKVELISDSLCLKRLHYNSAINMWYTCLQRNACINVMKRTGQLRRCWTGAARVFIEIGSDT